jgi:hypothetical protein
MPRDIDVDRRRLIQSAALSGSGLHHSAAIGQTARPRHPNVPPPSTNGVIMVSSDSFPLTIADKSHRVVSISLPTTTSSDGEDP